MTTTVILLAASNIILAVLVWTVGWGWLEQSRRCQRLLDLEAERRARHTRPLTVVYPTPPPAA